jgi:hypothetical protein
VSLRQIHRRSFSKWAAAAARLAAVLILFASVGGLWYVRTVVSPWVLLLIVVALAVTVGVGLLRRLARARARTRQAVLDVYVERELARAAVYRGHLRADRSRTRTALLDRR